MSRLVFLFCVWLLAMPLHADVVHNLYRAKVEVADRSEANREDAFRRAMVQVIRKVTGSQYPERNPVISSALRRSKNYLQDFSYSTSQPAAGEAAGTETARETTWLDAGFSSDGITTLVRSAGLPVWSSNRPDILVWLVLDDAGRRQFVALTDGLSYDEFERQMNSWGLPLVTPVMDLQDQIAASVNTLWELDEQAIMAASDRYEADSVLVGRMAKTSNGQYRGSWHYFFQQENLQLEARSPDMAGFFRQGVDGVVNFLSSRYAIDHRDNRAATLMTVSNITDFRAYSRTLSFLEGLEPVRQVEVKAVQGDTLQLELFVEGRMELLQELIVLGGLLQQETAAYQPSPANQPASGIGERPPEPEKNAMPRPAYLYYSYQASGGEWQP